MIFLLYMFLSSSQFKLFINQPASQLVNWNFSPLKNYDKIILNLIFCSCTNTITKSSILFLLISQLGDIINIYKKEKNIILKVFMRQECRSFSKQHLMRCYIIKPQYIESTVYYNYMIPSRAFLLMTETFRKRESFKGKLHKENPQHTSVNHKSKIYK